MNARALWLGVWACLGCEAEAVLFKAPASPAPAAEPAVAAVVVSSLGNSLPAPSWVQGQVRGVAVNATGVVATTGDGDFSVHPAARLFRAGAALADLELSSHAWGRVAGREIAIDDKHVYVSLTQVTSGKPGEDYPPAGETWHCVGRFGFDGKGAAFSGGRGWSKSYVIASKTAAVRGLAVRGDRLFVSLSDARVAVYDTKSMSLLRTLTGVGPGRLAVDAEDALWIVHDEPDGTSTVRHVAADGAVLPEVIDVGAPVASVSFDFSGRLWVAAAGPRQQVIAYDVGGAAPAAVETIGEPGGPWGDGSGRVGPLRFFGLTGAAVDGGGNLYVGQHTVVGQRAVGTRLTVLDPERAVLWSLDSARDGGAAVLPGSDGHEIVTAFRRYRVDFTKAPGHQGEWRALLASPARFPRDARLAPGSSGVTVRELQGLRFLFTLGRAAVDVFRFDRYSEAAIPVGRIEGGDAVLGTTPASWRDRNGDGGESDDERVAFGGAPWGAWNVDARGEVWAADTAGLVRVPALSVDETAGPKYGAPERLPMPARFTSVRRLHHDVRTGAVFVAGFVDGGGKDAEEDALGTEIARFDDPRTGAAARFRLALPNAAWGLAMDEEDGRLYVVGGIPRVLRVIDAASGSLLGEVALGRTLGVPLDRGESPFGAVRAFRRASGEHLVLVEDRELSRTVMVRLPPGWWDK